MTKANSSKRSKPRKDFPLTAHPRGHWCKKVLGKIRYFGKIADDPDGQEAIKLWLAQKDILLAGEDPRDYQTGQLTVADLVGHFLDAKQKLVDVGQLAQKSLDEYHQAAIRMGSVFGKHRAVSKILPRHFDDLHADIRKAYGLHKTATSIQRVRTIFKWGFENGYCDAVRFGSNFRKPPKREFRIHKAQSSRQIEADEIRSLIDAADTPQKAQILLAINAGLGNDDCCQLPITALDLERGWLTWFRPKTGIDRRAKLWPETVEAIRKVLKIRKPTDRKELRDLVFITKYGNAWTANAVRQRFDAAVKAAKISRDGLTFYGLRHSFKTVAEESGDESATEFIMGHVARDSMSDNYRTRFADERLERVADHVRNWLFPSPSKAADAGQQERTGSDE